MAGDDARQEPGKAGRHAAAAAAATATAGGEEDEALACVCRQADEGGEFYIGCNGCEDWYHPDCVGLPAAATQKEAESKKKSAMLEAWLCPACTGEPKQPLPGSKAAALGVDWEAAAAPPPPPPPPPPPKKAPAAAAAGTKLVLKRKKEESTAKITLRALGVDAAVWRAGLDGAEAAAFRERYGSAKQPLSYAVLDYFVKE